MDEGIVVNDPNRKSGDDSLLVKFLDKLVLNKYRSEKEGRPIHETQTYISIVVPGTHPDIRERKATEQDKERFWKQWNSYQKGHSDKVEGTPVTEWASLERTRAEDLKHMRFFTVEQLAAASDVQCQQMGPDGFTLRTKARMFIASAKDSAAAEAAAARAERLEQENQRLQDQIADLANRLKMIEVGAAQIGRAEAVAKVQ